MDYGQSDTNNDFFSASSLENYLAAEGVWYKFIANLNKITKPLVFLADKNPVMVIVPGATSPVKHKNISMTIIDKSLLAYETIYGGGGARDRLVELRTKDIIRLTGAIVEDVII